MNLVSFHVNLVFFHVNLAFFHVNLVSFHVNLVSFHVNLVSFHVNLVSFHVNLVSFHVNLACIRVILSMVFGVFVRLSSKASLFVRSSDRYRWFRVDRSWKRYVRPDIASHKRKLLLMQRTVQLESAVLLLI